MQHIGQAAPYLPDKPTRSLRGQRDPGLPGTGAHAATGDQYESSFCRECVIEYRDCRHQATLLTQSIRTVIDRLTQSATRRFTVRV